MNNRYVLAALTVTLCIGTLIWWGVQDGKRANIPLSPLGLVLYWGDGCSHCKNLEVFLQENQIEQKVTFERKEVWGDRANAKEMSQRAKDCDLSPTEIGVPFLFSDGKCFTGEPDVKKEFERRAGMVETSSDETE